MPQYRDERRIRSDRTKEHGVIVVWKLLFVMELLVEWGWIRCGNTLMVAVPADCYGHLGLL